MHIMLTLLFNSLISSACSKTNIHAPVPLDPAEHDPDVPVPGDDRSVQQQARQRVQRRVGPGLYALPPLLQDTPLRRLWQATHHERQLQDTGGRQHLCYVPRDHRWVGVASGSECGCGSECGWGM